MESASIYLDFQASAPIDESVAVAMYEWLRGSRGNPHSTEHAVGWAARDAVERSRSAVATVVGADPVDIVFTSGSTEANNLALFGVAQRAPPGRKTILVSAIEHSSVLEPARALASRGFHVVELPVDSAGRLQLEALERELDDRVLLVSVGAINNEIGICQDLQAIGDRCRAVGALFHSDATQVLTGRALSLACLSIDLASLSSHKAHGPSGIGALYVAPGRSDRIAPQVLGGGQQRLRAGTLPTALCVGFGRACEILASAGTAERVRTASLRDCLWQMLSSAVPGIEINGPTDFAQRHPGNLNVSIGGVDARDLIQRLQPTLACSTGSACHSGSAEASHVLSAIGLDEKRSRSSVRLSLGRQTTNSDVERAVALVKLGVAELLTLG